MATIVVQRGHYPRTTGATGAPGEQNFAFHSAERVRVHCRALGHEVRIIDADTADANYRGDVFVAIHYDSSVSPNARGASVGYQTDEGHQLAAAWKDHYGRNGWDGGWRDDNYTTALARYYGVREAVGQGNRRAIIIEAGFHSNPGNAELLAAPGGPDRVGRSVAAAMVDLFGCRCPSGAGPTPPRLPRPRPFPGTVQLGASGSGVRVWQDVLNERGADPQLVEDGEFGPRTDAMVRRWQRAHGLAVDGVAGPATWHSLMFDPNRGGF